jgi:predicted nucleic-acid-binding protein
LKITADTNLLVRAVTEDNPNQSKIAQKTLAEAELVAITLPSLCELAWILSSGYEYPKADIAEGMRRLVDGENVCTDRRAVDAGFALMAAGADFADGVIAYEGQRLGGEIFVSFDQRAVERLAAQNITARLLA